MKLTPTIYNEEYKSNANYAFSSMYNTLAQAVQARNKDMQDDEVNQLVNDIIISNVLGTVTSFDRIHALATLKPSHISTLFTALDQYAHTVHEDEDLTDTEKDTLQNIIKELETIL